VFVGNAILEACRDIKAQLRRMAIELEVADRDIGYPELLKLYYGSSRGEVISIGSERSNYIPTHPLGGKPAFWELMCVAAEVEVDPETGMTQIHKLVLVTDVGKALNPRQVEAQDEGAAMMGLGHTLMEQLILDDHGRILNLGALDYRIPTIQDIPLELRSVLIENGDGPGPFGAKGAGEGGILAVSAAVGSAVAEAVGVTIRDLPLTPERIWHSIQQISTKEEQTTHG